MKYRIPELHWLVLGIAALIFFAVGRARVLQSSNDFVPVYTGARCLLHGCNPYDTAQLETQFFAGAGHRSELPSWDIDVPVYPPSTFLTLSPLALLNFPAARLAWFLLNTTLFVTAAGLILGMCPRACRWPATVMVSIVLATSGILLVLGQPAILAISLLIIGSNCLLRGRLLSLGAILLMLSLAIKPQIGGFIVLYLLVRRIQWRYAAAAMAGAALILLWASVLLHHHPRSADWLTTLRANLSATLSTGGSADPRPANQQSVGDINLQALTSIYSADAQRFNSLAYAIFAALLGLWMLAVLRAKDGTEVHLVALGALAVLSLTPIYHRFYDSRLLLLTVPAAIIIAQKRRLLGVIVALVTLLAVISVQFRVQGYLLQHAQFQGILEHKVLFLFLLRQQNLELLMLVGLYLFALVSIRFSSAPPWETVAVAKSDFEAAYHPAMPLS